MRPDLLAYIKALSLADKKSITQKVLKLMEEAGELVNDVQIKKKVLDNESPLTLCMAEQLAKALRVPLESVRFGVHSVTPYVPEQRKSLHEHFGSGNIVKDRWIPPN